MATKGSSSREAARPRKANANGSRKGGRPGGQRRHEREVIVVQQSPNIAMYVLIGVVSLLVLLVGILLAKDLLAPKTPGAGTPAANQQPGQQQGPSLQQLEAAVKAQPTNAQARLDLAWGYYQNRQVDKAKVEVDTVLKADPNNIQAIDYSGLIAATEGKADEAIKLFDRGLALNPADRIDLLWDKATVLVAMKRYAEAIPVYEEFARQPRIKGSADEQTAKKLIEDAKAELAKQK